MKNIIYFLFLGFSAYTYSQNNISGTVTDNNNNPLLGVEIYIEQLHIGTTTDDSGKFTLQNIPKGRHEVSFQYLGFETQKLMLNPQSDNHSLQIVMTESSEHFDEIIVSTPFNKLQKDNVMKVEHKSIEMLQKQGGATLVDNLTTIPGVEQISTGTGIGKPVIRGLTGNRVLVYTQGVRLENQQYGSEHGLGLNQAGLSGVEVIKGPASLLYGSDALGGVMYFIPEKFALTNQFNTDIQQQFFSNSLGSQTSAGAKWSNDQIKLLVRGTYGTHADYELPDGDRTFNTRFNEKDFKAGFGFNTDFWVGELRYNFIQSEIGIPDGDITKSNNRAPLEPYQTIDNHIVSLHNHFYFNNSKLDVNLGYTSNTRKEFEDHEHGHRDHDEDNHANHDEDHHDEDEQDEHDEEAALNMELNTFTYEAKYYLPSKSKFESIVGFQGMSQTNTNHGDELLIPDATTNDIGVFATSLYSLNSTTSLQAGLRFDTRFLKSDAFEVEDHDHGTHEEVEAVDRNFNSLNFSFGIKSDITDQFTLRFNIASGFRAPNLAELTSHGTHHGTNRIEIGNPNLDSEQNYQLDLGLQFDSEHLDLFANGFYNNVNNYIYASPTGEIEDDLPVFEYIQNDAHLYGGEFGAHYHPHPIDWLHIESSYEIVIGEQGDEYLPLIPANKWSNAIRTEFKGNEKFSSWFASLQWQHTLNQNKVSAFETSTPGYDLFNFYSGVNINFSKSTGTINFGVNNLFNKEYTAHLSRLKNLNLANPGRNFVLSLKWQL